MSVLNRASHSEGMSNTQQFHPKLRLRLFNLAFLILFCYAWTTVWIYLQLSRLSENVALRQRHKPFPTWTLMIFLWYLDPLLGLPLLFFCRVICAMGLGPVLFILSSSPRLPLLALHSSSSRSEMLDMALLRLAHMPRSTCSTYFWVF